MHRFIQFIGFGIIWLVALTCSLFGVTSALAQTAPSPSAASSAVRRVPASAPSGAAPSPRPGQDQARAEENAASSDATEGAQRAARFAETVRDIELLLQRQLPPERESASLFDIDVHDERAVRLEALRLAVLLDKRRSSMTDAGTLPLRSSEADAGAPPARTGENLGAVSAREWKARMALDAARLRFYSLEPEARQRLFDAHEERRLASRQTEADVALGDAERRAQEAERLRKQALQAAQNARSEALRLVAEETARLLGIEREQAEFEKSLVQVRTTLVERRETMLGWQRRVRETREAARVQALPKDAVNRVYAELREYLVQTRQQLASALSEVIEESRVPGPGQERLGDLPEGVDARVPREKREQLTREARKLRELERELRNETADQLYEQAVTLNAERLALYPYLSDARRGDVVGFGPRGLGQASAEARQVVLAIRYRIMAAARWLTSLREGGSARSESALAVSFVALKWMIPVGVFVWWRRRSDAALTRAREAARAARRRVHAVTQRPMERVVAFVQRVHRPAESLLLLSAVLWLLPSEVHSSLEVELISTVLFWTLGGRLVVSGIDALAERRSRLRSHRGQFDTSELRLRSLRLVGRVVVTIGLVLSLSEDLVGRGTIYSWVLSTCWFAAIPVAMVITRWWREVIFERLEARRKKPPIMQWALRQKGWKSLPVALGAGLFLLGEGVARALKPTISSFDITRRFLAYLFRRGMHLRADGARGAVYQRLPIELFTALGPSAPSKKLVGSVADEQVTKVIERIDAPGGGVFAIVGERGSGKSTLLGRILAEASDVVLVNCPHDAESSFEAEFARAVGIAPGDGSKTDLERAAAEMNRSDRDSGLLVDDAHHLVLPKMGGLATFDRVLATARRNATHCSWVFAFDEVMWSFLARARGAKPLFDEVIRLESWQEEAIAELLISRSRELGVEPSFHGLVGDLPADADAVDREEALERTATGYYRLIWDYAVGNPGIALHTWRRCLGRDEQGEIAVKVFMTPDGRELETLPDSAVFVLRAVVQLEYGRREDISEATQLSEADVENALRFGVAHGYLEVREGRYWVTWAWFRPLTRFLQRRHLLTTE